MQNKNRYEVTGVVKQVRQYEGRHNITIAGFVLVHEGEKKTSEFKIICFNKLAQYMIKNNPVGHEIEVIGHLQIDKRGEVAMIGHKVNDLTLKKDEKPVDPFDSLKEDEVKVQKIEMLDKKTNIAIKSFDSIKDAASYAAVKKSKIEHAIKSGKEAGGYYWRRVTC